MSVTTMPLLYTMLGWPLIVTDFCDVWKDVFLWIAFTLGVRFLKQEEDGFQWSVLGVYFYREVLVSSFIQGPNFVTKHIVEANSFPRL